MFFLYNLQRSITLHPSYFGKNMHELVTGKLLKDVEGTCTGSYYIISIMDTTHISEGRILPGSGLAEFTVHYRAVVWRPFKGETVKDSLRGAHSSYTSVLNHNIGGCCRDLCQPTRLFRRCWPS